MKKKMDLYEFRDYCEAHPFKAVWFYTEDQDSFAGWEPLVLRLQLERIVFHMSAPGIELQDGKTRVFLRNVTQIVVDEDSVSPSRIVSVTTETFGPPVVFTLLLKI